MGRGKGRFCGRCVLRGFRGGKGGEGGGKEGGRRGLFTVSWARSIEKRVG